MEVEHLKRRNRLKARSEEQDPYQKEIKRLGVNCDVIPVLNFEYVNLDVLGMRLDKPDLYSGLVLTSPRAVKAVTQARTPLPDAWRKKLGFAVGESTAALAQAELDLVLEGGSETGNGRALAEYIIERHLDEVNSLPLLMPSADSRREELPRLLESAGARLEPLVVYKSVPHPSLEDSIESRLSASPPPSIVVFFSPSGVDAALPILRDKNIPLERVKWVAIGPTTETHLKSLGLTVAATCGRPTPKEVSEAVAALAPQGRRRTTTEVAPDRRPGSIWRDEPSYTGNTRGDEVKAQENLEKVETNDQELRISSRISWEEDLQEWDNGDTKEFGVEVNLGENDSIPSTDK